MDIRKIIREEVNEFDWANDVSSYPFDLSQTDKRYKVWFGQIPIEKQSEILDYIHGIGIVSFDGESPDFFDSMFFGYGTNNRWYYFAVGCNKEDLVDGQMTQDNLNFDKNKYIGTQDEIVLDREVFM